VAARGRELHVRVLRVYVVCKQEPLPFISRSLTTIRELYRELHPLPFIWTLAAGQIDRSGEVVRSVAGEPQHGAVLAVVDDGEPLQRT
jgi:hypothetical protein